MKTFFLDTSYLLALVLRDDAHHPNALQLQKSITGRLLTTEYFPVEFIDALLAVR